MKLAIEHETRYEYSAPLQYAMQQICLTPRPSGRLLAFDQVGPVNEGE